MQTIISMYRPNFIQKQTFLIIFALMAGFFPGNAQCDLTCKNQITQSIAPLDQLTLSYDMILAGDYSACNPEDFIITLKDENGVFVNPPVIKGSHIGQTMTALIIDENTSTSCNSFIDVVGASPNCIDTLYIDINTSISGDEMEVSFDVSNFTELASVQMSIHYDPQMLNFLDYINSDLDGMYPSNFSESSPGIIRMLWYNITGGQSTLPDGSSIFKLKFYMLDSGSTTFEIRNEPIPIEIATGEGKLFCLNLNGQNVDIDNTGGNASCQLDCLADVVASYDGTPTTINAKDFFIGNTNICPDLDLVVSLFSPSGAIAFLKCALSNFLKASKSIKLGMTLISLVILKYL